MMPWRLTAGALAALAAAAGAAAPDEEAVKTYSFGLADPAFAVEAARMVVGTNGSVVLEAAGHRLLVRAPTGVHARLKALMAEVAEPPRNVRIDVAFRDRSREKQTSAAVDGGIVVDERGSGARVRLTPRADQSRARTSAETQQSLVVASGREASMFVGEDVPL